MGRETMNALSTQWCIEAKYLVTQQIFFNSK